MEEFAEKRGVQALLDVAQVVTDALVADGLEAGRARELGLLAAEKLRDVYGGDQVYIPRGLALLLSKRDLEIYQKFNGSNHFALAKEHGLTERQVYNIIERVRREMFARQQPGLPFETSGEDPEAA